MGCSPDETLGRQFAQARRADRQRRADAYRIQLAENRTESPATGAERLCGSAGRSSRDGWRPPFRPRDWAAAEKPMDEAVVDVSRSLKEAAAVALQAGKSRMGRYIFSSERQYLGSIIEAHAVNGACAE
jgi:hypothetical protein